MGTPGWREMASKMGSGQPGLGNLSFLTLCALFPTLSPAFPGGCFHCPFLLSCLLPSPLVLTAGKWQLSCYACLAWDPLAGTSANLVLNSQAPTLPGHGDTWVGCCPCLGLFVAGSHVPPRADQSAYPYAQACWPWRSSYAQSWHGCSCLVLKRERM